MVIIHLEEFFHPDAGYQVNILSKYMVMQGHKVIVLTSKLDKMPSSLTSFFGKENIYEKDKMFEKKTGVIIKRVPIRKFISGRAIHYKSYYHLIEKLKPDIVYSHGESNITAMYYALNFNKLKYPIIMDSHMIEMASENKLSGQFNLFYRKFIAPKIIKNKIQVIRTQDDRYVEKCLGIPLEQAPWISVGSDTLLFKPDDQVRKRFRKEYKIGKDAFVAIYTGKLSESKGGLLLSQAFKEKFKNQKDKSVVLLIVGNIENNNYGKLVEQTLGASENRIIHFPTQKYLDLPQFYQAADLSIFPKQCSLSFYDAQACGLPVVSEDNNINIDRLRYNNGFNFKADSIKDFRQKILDCINMDQKSYKKMGDNAYEFVKDNYDYKDIAKKYESILIQEYNKFHGIEEVVNEN